MPKHFGVYWLSKRVQIPAHTDLWMRGDRYGEVVKTDGDTLVIKMDKSGKMVRVKAATIEKYGEVVD